MNEGENVEVAEAYERAELFVKIGRELGLDVHPEYNPVWWLDGRGMREWLNSGTGVTAVILRTENLAAAFYKAALEFGLRLPEDMSVIAFDSTEYCDAISPRLTAISQPVEEMARQAAEILIHSIEGQDIPGRRLAFPCGLDIRESTTTHLSKQRVIHHAT